MSKRTSARAFFEALGRSAASRGLPMNIHRRRQVEWPRWAREAWARGWIHQTDYSMRKAHFKGIENGR